MVGHGGSSAGSYLADPTSPIPSHCASVVVTSTLRANLFVFMCECIFKGQCPGVIHATHRMSQQRYHCDQDAGFIDHSVKSLLSKSNIYMCYKTPDELFTFKYSANIYFIHKIFERQSVDVRLTL